MIRRLLLYLALACPVFAAEELTAAWSFQISQTTGGSGTNTNRMLGFQIQDRLNPASTFVGKICIDSTVFACANSVNITANCGGYNRTGCGAGHSGAWSPNDGVMGAVSPTDGSQHYIVGWAVGVSSNVMFAGGDANGKMFFTWDSGHTNFLWFDTPVTTTASPVTAAKRLVVVDTSQAYSLGVSGADVCVSGANHLKDDGVGGYFVQKYSIPCANVIYCAPGGTNTITGAAFITACGTQLDAAVTAGVGQAISAAWVFPSVVTFGTTSGTSAYGNCVIVGTKQDCASMTAILYGWPTYHGAEPSPTTRCLGQSYGPGWGPSNPAFNSGTTGSLTTAYGVWPASMLAWARCPTCPASPGTNSSQQWVPNFADAQSGINAVFTAIGSNPTINASLALTTVSASGGNLAIIPALQNTGINALINYVPLGFLPGGQVGTDVTAGLTTITGLYQQNSQTWRFLSGGSSLNAKAGAGIAFATGSITGQLLQSTGSTQSPATSWLTQTAGGMTGTVFSAAYGTAIEPCQSIPLQQPDFNLLLSYMLAGWPIDEAMAKSLRIVLKGNLIGDPNMAPYVAPLPSAMGTFSIVKNTRPVTTWAGIWIAFAGLAFVGVRRVK